MGLLLGVFSGTISVGIALGAAIGLVAGSVIAGVAGTEEAEERPMVLWITLVTLAVGGLGIALTWFG